MLKNQDKKYLFVGLVLIFLLLGIEVLFAQPKPVDFLGMKGDRFTHICIDKNDILSAQEIIELRNEKGLAVWFGRDFQKIVCLTGLCRKVHLWLFWDGCGNYLGFQEYPEDPLTKTDHAVFMLEDYLKLHQILCDSVSVLKDLKQEDLTVSTEKVDKNPNIDAVTGATQASLQEYLVRNAAYTCYTLWHTVYGNTRTEILDILDQRVDYSYLQLLFNEDNPEYLIWAIIFIKKHPKYHTGFNPQIIRLIKSNNENLSRQALNYFTQQQLCDVNLQRKLLQIFEEISYQRKFELIWKLTDVPKIDDEAILYLLGLFTGNRINASLLRYTYKLIHSDNLKNPKVLVKLSKFSKDKNMYVRNLTNNLLAQVSVGN